MNQVQQLRDLIAQSSPKHIGHAIKRDANLHEWVSSFPGDSLSEKAFSALGNSPVCENGNSRKFKSIIDGYVFCGKTCECANASRSFKVTQYQISSDQAIKSQKRAATLQKKYGVSNAGQTQTAKDRHAALYQDAEKVSKIVHQVNQTKLERYGDPQYNNSAKIRETWKNKELRYFENRYPHVQFDLLKSPEKFKDIYDHGGVESLVEQINIHPQTAYTYLKSYGIRTPFVSVFEQDIHRWLESLGIEDIVRNTRSIISKELDFYLPEHNLAIEANGVYWHHDEVSHIDRNYHWSKFSECRKIGIDLISIYDFQWYSDNRFKQLLQHKLGLSDKQCGARETNIVEISGSEARQFYQAYHIKGWASAQHHYGAMHQDQLIAAISFSKPRRAAGSSQYDLELVRFAVSGHVPGIGSKLFSHATRLLSPQSVVSYSDNEYSNGGVYRSLGFSLSHELKPSYWYWCPKKKKQYHRYNFTKHSLVRDGYDKSKTEKEIMSERGYLRVWDAGKQVWVWCNS